MLNNEWKVDAIESNRSLYHQLEMEIGRKYIKVWENLVRNGVEDTTAVAGCSLTRTLENVTNQHHYKAPAKGVRYLITQLADNPHICDPYGSFLYL